MIILKGTSFYQENIKKLDTWSLGYLQLEPTNPYDAEACAVYVEDNIVGYLPKGWRQGKVSEDLISYIDSPHQNKKVSLLKVGGFKLNNGKVATTGLRIITRDDLIEDVVENEG